MAKEKSKPAFIVCGALMPEVKQIVQRRGWNVDLYPLSPDYHLEPADMLTGVEEKLKELAQSRNVLVVYGDCGTGGLLDKLLERYKAERLPGAHCYEIYGGEIFHESMAKEPGTFFLTDFMVRSFERLKRQMGLDDRPELVDLYFRNYRRIVYLAQTRDSALLKKARDISMELRLPLEVRYVGTRRLEKLIEEWMND